MLSVRSLGGKSTHCEILGHTSSAIIGNRRIVPVELVFILLFVLENACLLRDRLIDSNVERERESKSDDCMSRKSPPP